MAVCVKSETIATAIQRVLGIRMIVLRIRVEINLLIDLVFGRYLVGFSPPNVIGGRK
jgi:hypothetical protein